MPLGPCDCQERLLQPSNTRLLGGGDVCNALSMRHSGTAQGCISWTVFLFKLLGKAVPPFEPLMRLVNREILIDRSNSVC